MAISLMSESSSRLFPVVACCTTRDFKKGFEARGDEEVIPSTLMVMGDDAKALPQRTKRRQRAFMLARRPCVFVVGVPRVGMQRGSEIFFIRKMFLETIYEEAVETIRTPVRSAGGWLIVVSSNPK